MNLKDTALMLDNEVFDQKVVLIQNRCKKQFGSKKLLSVKDESMNYDESTTRGLLKDMETFQKFQERIGSAHRNSKQPNGRF